MLTERRQEEIVRLVYERESITVKISCMLLWNLKISKDCFQVVSLMEAVVMRRLPVRDWLPESMQP